MDISLANGGYDNNNIIPFLSYGNIGIGITNPTSFLYANGNANINGNISSTGSIGSITLITSATNFISNSGISTFKSMFITNPNGNITHLPFTKIPVNVLIAYIGLSNNLLTSSINVLKLSVFKISLDLYCNNIFSFH